MGSPSLCRPAPSAAQPGGNEAGRTGRSSSQAKQLARLRQSSGSIALLAALGDAFVLTLRLPPLRLLPPPLPLRPKLRSSASSSTATGSVSRNRSPSPPIQTHRMGFAVDFAHRHWMTAGFQDDDVAWFQVHDFSSPSVGLTLGTATSLYSYQSVMTGRSRPIIFAGPSKLPGDGRYPRLRGSNSVSERMMRSGLIGLSSQAVGWLC